MEECVKEQKYLFVFAEGELYESAYHTSFKDAMGEMATYTGNDSEMFRKLLFSNAFGENEVDKLIELFNYRCYYSPIEAIYVIKEKLYG